MIPMERHRHATRSLGCLRQEDINRLREDMPQLLFATPWRLVRASELELQLRSSAAPPPRSPAAFSHPIARPMA